MKKFVSVFVKGITILTFVLLGIVFLQSIFNEANLIFTKSVFKYPFILYILFSIVFLFLLMCIFKRINKASLKKMKWVKIASVVVLILGQILIIKVFNPVQVTDSYVINNQAISIAEGVEKSVDVPNYPYFGQYYNNNFVLVVSIYLARFFKLIHLDYTLGYTLFNVLMINVGVLLSYLIGKKVKDEKFATKLLVLNVFNPLNYLLVHWTYTVTYSIPGMLLMVYLALLLKDKDNSIRKKVLLSVGIGLCLILGYYMRPTIVIPFIAIFMCFCMYLILKKKTMKDFILPAIIIMLVSLVTYFGVGKLNKSYVDNGDTVWPLTHWVMMGLHGDGIVNEKDNSFTRGFKTKEEKKEANIKEIKKTLKSYGVNGFINHSLAKMSVNWAEGSGTYQYRISQDKNQTPLYTWIVGNKRDIVVVFCQIFRIVTLFLSLIGIFELLRYKNDKPNFRFMNILILFGGILFYLIWEAKTSYCVPFLPFIFILGVYGLDSMNKKVLVVNYKKVISAIFISVMVFTGLLGIIMYNPVMKKKINVNRYSVNVVEPGIGKYISNVNSKKLTIRQEFKSLRKFNRIFLRSTIIKKDKNINYILNLKDDKDEVIQSYKITIANIEEDYFILPVDSTKTKSNRKYIIEIKHGNSKEDSISFKWVDYKTIDMFDGSMYINGKEKKGDLFLKIYNKTRERFIGKQLYMLCFKVIIIGELLVYLYVLKVIKNESNSEKISKLTEKNANNKKGRGSNGRVSKTVNRKK